MMLARCLFTVLFLTASAAHADTVPLPDETVSNEDRQRFRLCRAAILVEQRVGEAERTLFPPATVTAMREQVAFIMAETVFNVPALNLEDGTRRFEFAERFMLDFSRTIGGEKDRLSDTAERTAILLDCQPMIWDVMKERIDVLMQWRRRALGLDRPFPVDDKSHRD